MKKITALVLATFACAFAHAADPVADSACLAAAKEKKLSGAARSSFVKKCESDAHARCALAATDRKLHGAAKNSNVRKCVREGGPSA